MSAPADDIDRIMAIMASAFEPRFGEAWSRRQLDDALLLGNCHALLIDSDGRTGEQADARATAGFALLRCGFDEEELLLFAVDPAWRRRGLGAALLARVLDEARARNSARVILEMRKGNNAGRLYQAAGFTAVGFRPGYYKTLENTRLDAITFALMLG